MDTFLGLVSTGSKSKLSIESPQNENCHHLTFPDIDNFFCSCPSCKTTFWAGYADLFCGDSIDSLDLEPVDTNPRKVDDSEPLKEKDATRDSSTLPEFELGNGDKSIFDATNNSVSNSSGKSSTTSKTTPQGNSGHQLIADVNSKHSTADNSSISSSKPACDAKTTTTGDVFYNLDPVLCAEPKHATSFTTARSNSTAERNYNVIAQSAYEYHTAKYPELFNFHFVDLSGDMYDEWPQVFYQLSQRAYEATTREDGNQIPEAWKCLITGLPFISDAFWFHLFSERERCLEIILCALSRIVCAVITKWPTNLTPTIFRRREYVKHLAWNPDGMVLDSIMWRKVLIDKVIKIKSNQRKFPQGMLRLALFTMAKASQHRHMIESRTIPSGFQARCFTYSLLRNIVGVNLVGHFVMTAKTILDNAHNIISKQRSLSENK